MSEKAFCASVRFTAEDLTDVFSTLREYHDKRLPVLRGTIVVFYAVGFVLITVVFLQNLASVLRAVLR